MKKVLLLILTLVGFKVSAQNNFPATGNVTIGTAAPGTALLDVNGATRLRNVVEMSNAQFFAINAYNNATAPAGWKYRVAGFASSFVQDAVGNFTFNLGGGPSAASGAINTSVAWRPIYTILNNGNLGIGSISPTEKLELVGNMKFPSGGNHFISAGGLSSFGESFSTADAYHGSMVKSNVGTAEFVKTATGLGSLITMQANDGIRFQTNLAGASGTPITTALRNAGEVMRITHSGFVGIGTAAPANKLHIVGAAGTSGLRFGNLTSASATSLTNNKVLSVNASGDVILVPDVMVDSTFRKTISVEGVTGIGTAQKMSILTNGNIGIGVATPAAKLDITTGTAGNSGLKLSNLPNSTANTFLTTNATGNVILATATGGSATPIDSTLRKVIGVQGALGNYGTGQKMQIMTNGFVGVGTLTPTALMHLGGSTNKGIQVNTALNNAAFLGGWQDQAILSVNRDAWSGNFMDATKTASSIQLEGLAAGSNIQFYTTPTPNTLQLERMRIIANGNVGIGMVNPQNSLSVMNNQAAPTSISVSNAGTVSSNTLMQFLLSEDGSSTHGFLRRYRDGTGLTELGFSNDLAFSTGVSTIKAERMRIMADGKIGIGTNSPVSQFQVVAPINNTFGTASFRTSGGAKNPALWINNDETTGVSSIDFTGTTGYSGRIKVGNLDVMSFSNSSNVGIGTLNPTAKLEIASPLNSSGLKLGGLAGATPVASNSKALSVDATGNVILVNAATSTTTPVDSTLRKVIGVEGEINAYTTTPKLKIMSNGNVGIGTLNPQRKLHLIGGGGLGISDAASNGISSFSNDGTSTTFNSFTGLATGSSDLIFTNNINNTASSEKMRILGNGNVGIGKSSPVYKLDVNGDINTNGYLSTGTGPDGYYGSGVSNQSNVLDPLDLDFNRAANNKILRINHHSGVSMSAHSVYGGIRFYNQGYTSTTTNPYLSSNGSIMVMAINNGNVGIGITSPTSPLHVIGNSTLQGSSTTNYVPTILFKRSEGLNMYSIGPKSGSIANSPLDINSINGNPINLSVANVERLTINETGNIGIGTTNPAAKLDITATAGTSGLKLSTLTNTDANKFLTTDANGNVTLGTVNNSSLSVDSLKDALVFHNNCTYPENFAGISIKTKIPFENHVMGNISIEGYNYGIQKNINLQITYYSYKSSPTTPWYFHNGTISTSGSYNPEVKLYNDGGFVHIFIPKGTESQYCINFKVKSWNKYGSNLISWHQNWSATNIATDPTSALVAENKITLTYKNNFQGNVGIGTDNPAYNLHVKTVAGPEKVLAAFGMSGGTKDPGVYLSADENTGVSAIHFSGTGGFSGRLRVGNTNVMSLLSSGNIGIGTTTPKAQLDVNQNVAIGLDLTTVYPVGYKLAVGGNIIAEKVKVRKQSAGWPDFVFKKDYKLMTLPEIEAFVNKNSHLPEIPSASEIEKDGQDLGEMNRLLLKKVEELTLYIINQDKEITKLRTTSEAIATLQKQIDELKTIIKK
jgi:hypothetical protein